MSEKIRLSVCLITKNEAGNLPRCLESLEGAADEVVVVDTGSTDKTMEIARALGARVVPFAWRDNFAAARNRSIEAASGDWILILDADERLVPGSGAILRELVEQDGIEAYYFRVINYLGREPGAEYETSTSYRLFRRGPEWRYEGRVHEQLKPTRRPTGRYALAPIEILHHGYLSQRYAELEKAARNIRLLEAAVAEAPDDPYYRYNLAVTLYGQGRYAEAANHLESALPQAPAGAHYLPRLIKVAALTYEQLGAVDRAISLLDHWIPRFLGQADLPFVRGTLHLEKGRVCLAQFDFQLALARGRVPDALGDGHDGTGSYRPLYGLARTSEILGDWERAEQLARAALARHRRFLPPIELLFRVFRVRRADPVSLVDFLAWEKPEDMRQLCLIAYSEGFSELANDQLAAISRQWPGHPIRWETAAHSAFWSRDWGKAVDYLQAALQAGGEPHSLSLWLVALAQLALENSAGVREAVDRLHWANDPAGRLQRAWGAEMVALLLGARSAPGEASVRQIGCLDRLLPALALVLPGQDWSRIARWCSGQWACRVATSGWRRALEIHPVEGLFPATDLPEASLERARKWRCLAEG